MICNIIGCNAEGYVKLVFYYFQGDMKKPFCKKIMRVCEVHARQITEGYKHQGSGISLVCTENFLRFLSIMI
jgi:hypothetical protein